MRASHRDVLAGVSLANLCYLRLWAELFGSTGRDAYFLKNGANEFLGAILSVIVLGSLFAIGAQLTRRFAWLRPIAFLALAFVAFLILSNLGRTKEPGLLYLASMWRKGRVVEAGAIAIGIAVFLAALAVWRDAIVRRIPAVLLALAAFLPFTLGRAAWLAFASRPVAGWTSVRAVPADGPAVVLVVFDGMGRRIAFEDRPPGIDLPAFDRLRAESVDARQVLAAGTATGRVMPALLSGVVPRRVEPIGESDLRLTLADGSRVAWSGIGTLFDDAQRIGGRASVVGWYHPYCRVFPRLDDCAWYSSTTGHGRIAESTILEAAFAEAAVLDPYTVHRTRQIRTWRRMLDDAKTVLSRRSRGFVLVHLNVPHVPPVWDAARGTTSRFLFSPRRYADSLEHADATLAELRLSMESAGTWDSSTVIVTSDHPAKQVRAAFDLVEETVPLFVKLPGSTAGVVHDAPVSAASTHALVRWLLTTPSAQPDDVVDWLDAHARVLPGDERGDAVQARGTR